ncbi:MAG: GldG family protein [Gallionella sp.]|nr:GldG family protein [Gallionella sp.]MDD4945899.1 GldG family protein [Gallionella sp.]
MLNKFLHSASLSNLLFAALLLTSVSGLDYLANRHPLQRDITLNASNSLEPASVSILKQLNAPLTITVYATEQDSKLGDIRKIIREFVSLYQRYKPDLKLVFIDPTKEPEKTRAARVQLNGEMVVEYAGRSEHLTQINEQTLTSMLLRLAHTRDQTVMYLGGHGERKLDGPANQDMGNLFGAKLKNNGFKINSLNLAIAQDVPNNTSVLVITQPQVDLMPGEVDKLLHYIDRGGNLLWLLDAEPLHGLERVADKLGLSLPPGIVIDPAATEMNAPATWSLGTTYPQHAITHGFNLITAFQSARPLEWNETADWQHHVLVEAAARGWVSSKPAAKFDKQHDTPGPAAIALAMQRAVGDTEQRVVVVGNGAFLSNSFAGNGGNVDLGVNMINWLASEEHLITLQPRAAKDSSLVLSKTQLTVISVGFLLGVPLLLAGVGGVAWWKRRRN